MGGQWSEIRSERYRHLPIQGSLDHLDHQFVLVGDAFEDGTDSVIDVQVTFIAVLKLLDNKVSTINSQRRRCEEYVETTMFRSSPDNILSAHTGSHNIIRDGGILRCLSWGQVILLITLLDKRPETAKRPFRLHRKAEQYWFLREYHIAVERVGWALCQRQHLDE